MNGLASFLPSNTTNREYKSRLKSAIGARDQLVGERFIERPEKSFDNVWVVLVLVVVDIGGTRHVQTNGLL